MLSVTTARALRACSIPWSPATGDRFVIADRDMDDEVFVLSDMTIEARQYPTGTVLGFNGTTEWALDSVAVEQALWLPREEQLRSLLGGAFVGLRRAPAGFEVGVAGDGHGRGRDEPAWTAARDVEEAYALAVLARCGDRDPLTLLPVAVEGFGWRVHAVEASSWDAATPVQGRTVRDLVGHVTAELLSVPYVPRDTSWDAAVTGARRALAGDDPVTAWEAAVDAGLRAWSSVEDPSAVVRLEAGTVPAREHAEHLLQELTVHAWDLACGAGIDGTLDAACVQHVLHRLEPPATERGQEPQERLLALTGRDPDGRGTVSS